MPEVLRTGNFEIHAPITDRNLQLLAKGNIISKRGSEEAGVIEDIENEESDIKNEITAKGRFFRPIWIEG